ncbi:MAG: DMT family transporter [Bacillus sp. (in: firmicutes)]
MKANYPFLLLILANIIWGGNFVVGNIGKDYISPFTFSLLRWGIAFILLTPFLMKSLVRDKRILWEHKWIILFLAFTGVAGYNTFIYFSFQWTTSINAAVINSMTPIFIVLLSFVLLAEKINMAQLIGIILSVAGVLFTLTRGSMENLLTLSFNKGDLLVILAVVSWALYSVFIKKYAQVLPTYSTFYATTLIGVLMLLPFSLYELSQPTAIVHLNAVSIGILFYVGFFAAIVAFLSWNIGVSKVGAAKASIYLNLLPIFAAGFAPLLTPEKIMWYQIVGGLIVILAVFISSRKKLSGVSLINRSKKEPI